MTRQTTGPVQALTPQGVLENVSITVEDGKIISVLPCTTPPKNLLPTAVPAFIDLHIHGAGGFGPEQGTAQSLLDMSAVLARQGVTAFCPALYCARPIQLAELLRKLVPALGRETGAKIIGFHLEGPFISPQKPGVMKPQDIAPANVEDFKQIYEAAQGRIAIVTLAPEVPGIEPVIEFCVAHHILVQAGHTNATYEQMQHAFDLGVHRVTHWGNAMSGLHQRAPGVVGAVLNNPQISCEVIADGKHIHPALLTLLKRVKPLSQITAVTDALLPTGQATGPFYANGEEVLLQDGVWKRKQDGVRAGSALTMAGACRQLYQAGYTLQEAAACTSTNAAQLLGLTPPAIVPGSPADFVILGTSPEPIHVFLHGRPLL